MLTCFDSCRQSYIVGTKAYLVTFSHLLNSIEVYLCRVMWLWVLQVTRMVVSTYQAASGAGAAAMEELELQTREVIIILFFNLSFSVICICII